MTYTDYCKILSDFGTYPIYRFLQTRDAKTNAVLKDPKAFEDLYCYVESGFPVLASLRLLLTAKACASAGAALTPWQLFRRTGVDDQTQRTPKVQEAMHKAQILMENHLLPRLG